MKAVALILVLAAVCCAQKVPAMRPVALTPPGTNQIAQAQPIPEVMYWKLAKLASDEEALGLRQALIRTDRQSIITSVCSGAGLKVEDCEITPDAKVQRRAK